jgi:cytochrome c oxidase assembly factor CtaG
VSPTLDACLRSWPVAPWLVGALIVSAGVYLRGWFALHRRAPDRWHRGHVAAFFGGLAAIYLALASPIEPLAALLLSVHMVQHLLLMMVAPPLFWLAAPLLPLLRGLPRPVRVIWAAPWLSSPLLRSLFGFLSHPFMAFGVFITVSWFWHVPRVYDLAMQSNGWHYLEHASFFGTALIFWYPVIRPYPAQPRWAPWLLLPVLLLADLSNTALAALLTFSDRALYQSYAGVPRLAGVSPLDDQSMAGVLMWVPGSIAFLLPLVVVSIGLLSGDKESVGGARSRFAGRKAGIKGNATWSVSERLSLPLADSVRQTSSSSFDVLRLPLVGRFLKWRHARLALQLPMVALAAVLIIDGIRGPQVGAMNLAGVLPWIHWRGLLIVTLLAAGNFFCTSCPFLVPRTLARRWLPSGRSWPRRLRNKWLAVGLVTLFLWSYEAFSLWDSPWWTAWLVIGYFVIAFVIDGFFRGAPFCKYLCPIGQFNFVQSLVSPLEVSVLDPQVCATCQTRDCIHGRDGVPGCELQLFQPRKVGNMDCTFCLDCIHACPHDNVGITARPVGGNLWRTAEGSGVGQLGKRPDVAALATVLVFGAFVNALGMVGPVLTWRDRLNSLLGLHSSLMVTSLFYLVGLLVLPLFAVAGAAVLSRRWGRASCGWFEMATRYSFALVPIGFSMWLAHYSFHLLTSYDTVVPNVQRFLAELGWPALGAPSWVAGCCRPVGDWLPHLEVLALDLGLLLSLYTGYRIALTQSVRLSQALWTLAPWALLIGLLFAVGIWIVFQPMEMRGTLGT